jgi:nitronate monooxygenase
MALGAGAVQVGTAFLACEESGAHPFHKEILMSDQAWDTTLTRLHTGRLARFVRNALIDELRGEHPLPFPYQSHVMAALKAAALEHRRADLAALYAGQGARLLRHQTAEKVFHLLLSD